LSHAEPRQDKAADQRAEDPQQAAGHELKRVRVQQALGADDVINQSVDHRFVDGERAADGDHVEQHVPQPHRVREHERADRQRGHRLDALRGDERPPSIGMVGQRAARETERCLTGAARARRHPDPQ
jgi:hypothetical protein